ncbi:MAG: penicillin-binding protein [Pseudomonadota bacterium]
MKSPQAKWTRFRLWVIFILFVLVFGVVVSRAFQLQVLEREKLAKIAEKESNLAIKLTPVRGGMFDRNGEKLAVSLEVDSIFAQPNKIKTPEKTAGALAPLLKADRKELRKKLQTPGSFVWLKRQADPEVVEAVRKLGLDGVDFVKETKRFYPNKSLAAHLLGFVGVDSQGLEGLELSYNEWLRGGDNTWRVRRDALGRIYLDQAEAAPEKNRGADIILTIDRRVQYIAEQALDKAVKEYEARYGVAVVIRPKTGEILASAVSPGFNPNVYEKYSPAVRRHRAFTDAFDPGSTFKIFIVSAALEEGTVKSSERIFCENGRMVVEKTAIHDHDPYGWLTVNEVIKYSSNIGTAKIGRKLGSGKMFDYLERFGFGQKTDVDYPGEVGGVLRPFKKWRLIDQANVAFGQGVSVTALQMAMAISALANDGLLMRPYLVSEIRDAEGATIKKFTPHAVRQAVASQTARELTEMLRLVVTAGGTGTRADPLGYPAAGKTGTAQKLDPQTGRYSDEKYFSSFLGFVPHDEPELTIFVGLDEPGPQIYGGTVAAPVFKEIAQNILPMMNIAPVRTAPTPDDSDSPRVKVAAAGGAKLQTTDVSNSISGEIRKPSAARVVSAYPGVMPDLEGLSMRRVLDLMSSYNVQVNFTGSGHAVSQEPAAGARISAGEICQVRFEHLK